MHTLLQTLTADWLATGTVALDVPAFLLHHGRPATAVHSAAVANEAQRIARLHGVDPERCLQAAWLHDVSAVFPGAERALAADALGLPVLPEERAFPPILHQKLSAALAREIFSVSDEGVLSAVACHTTLKAGATPLDLVVFIADKVAWDQPGVPPYADSLLPALEHSLQDAALAYLEHLWQHRADLPVVHPWMIAAREDLLHQQKGMCSCR